MNTKPLILLVEDNEQLSNLNRRALEMEGYSVLTALTLEDAREHVAESDPAVILLDILLPDGSGLDFCAETRDATDAHIIFLTSRTEHHDRVLGLDTGGDDYITKPYKLDELLARVNAALRRRSITMAQVSRDLLKLGPLTLDTVADQAFIEGIDLLLTPKEFSLLLLLAKNQGETVSTQVLYESIWKRPLNDDERAVWQQISRLKRKLEEHSSTLSIMSVRGQGYRLAIM